MKIIIPLAGLGKRLRPHTHTRAKPLVYVAGKPVLGHVLEQVTTISDIDEVIFITGYLGKQIEDYVKSNYNFKSRFIEQKELKGQAHAVQLARDYVKDDVLIWYVDTISDIDLSILKSVENDGIIFVKEVEDPRSFGLVVTDNKGIVKNIVEKPLNPIGNLVNIGIYYVKNSGIMFECIDELISKGMEKKGEYYLTDAFNIMIDKGIRFKTEKVSLWQDCGSTENLIEANRYFLKYRTRKIPVTNSVIIDPVYIEDGVVIKNSVIGPHVSIAKNAVISDSVIQESIINKRARIESSHLTSSIVGEDALVKGDIKKVNVGDHSEIFL